MVRSPPPESLVMGRHITKGPTHHQRGRAASLFTTSPGASSPSIRETLPKPTSSASAGLEPSQQGWKSRFVAAEFSSQWGCLAAHGSQKKLGKQAVNYTAIGRITSLGCF